MASSDMTCSSSGFITMISPSSQRAHVSMASSTIGGVTSSTT